MRVGLLHPGEMGAKVATALRMVGHTVLWASADRSEATVRRAKSAGLEDCVSTRELAQQCDVIFCLCPPAVAVEVARQVSRFAGIYVDANAISPATSRSIERCVPRYVDGAIIGPPPTERGSTRIYLSGREADTVGALFAATIIEPLVVSDAPGSASALKMAYSAWTKGTAALVLTIRSLARAEGIEQPLLHEWTKSLPDLRERSESAARSAQRYGWRWDAEMNEIADTFAAAGLPDGFHRAAAEIFRRSPRQPTGSDALESVLSAIRQQPQPDSDSD